MHDIRRYITIIEMNEARLPRSKPIPRISKKNAAIAAAKEAEEWAYAREANECASKEIRYFTGADFDVDEFADDYDGGQVSGWYYRAQATAPFTHKFWQGPFKTSTIARDARAADKNAV